MVTDDERRRAAAALRECLDGRVCLHNWRKTLLETVAEAVGMTAGDNPTAQDLCDRLADLIDPGTATDQTSDKTKSQDISLSVSLCDREELLALADEMDRDGRTQRERQKAGERWFIDGLDVQMYARRIREACGVVVDGR